MERTDLPVVCELHAGSASTATRVLSKTLSYLDDSLAEVELLAEIKETRDGLLNLAMLRVESWKVGVIRA
jgi:hypothetical protein